MTELICFLVGMIIDAVFTVLILKCAIYSRQLKRLRNKLIRVKDQRDTMRLFINMHYQEEYEIFSCGGSLTNDCRKEQ